MVWLSRFSCQLHVKGVVKLAASTSFENNIAENGRPNDIDVSSVISLC